MKTATSRLLSFGLDKDISQHPLVKAMIHAYSLSNLPMKRPLSMDWTLPSLLQYIASRPTWTRLSFSELTGICITLFMIFSVARFTEILRIPLNNSDPEPDLSSWTFITKVKGHNFVEPITIFSTESDSTNPIPALLNLRTRIKALIPTRCELENRFWYKEGPNVIELMRYNDIRYAVGSILKAAGLPHNRPYRIKHAVMTYLSECGTDARNLAMFARHSLESMVSYKHYVDNDKGKASVLKIAEAAHIPRRK
jgi:hypothetical protein